ncbi:MAG: hypothetical protein HY910_01415 [Desulfarculus sp.]|nr:hypothetical protein [Desulfarculus sp.]
MDWLWWPQLALDLVLLAGLGVLLWRLRGGSGSRPATPADLQRFIAEAARLSQDFDRLLAEKRELVGTTLKTLDDRIAHLQAMVSQIKNPPRAQAPSQAPAPAPAPAQTPVPPAAPAASPGGQDFRALVLQLAGQGKSAQEIASATGRPRGEVELVLGLTGQS